MVVCMLLEARNLRIEIKQKVPGTNLLDALIAPGVVAIQNRLCIAGPHLGGAGAEEAMFLRVLLVLALRRLWAASSAPRSSC
jgi:hypothetical protein